MLISLGVTEPAYGWKNRPGVSDNPNGTHIEIERTGEIPGSSGGGGGGSSCYFRKESDADWPARAQGKEHFGDYFNIQQPGQESYELLCDGRHVRWLWLDPGTPSTAADPRVIAERAVADVGLPAMGIGVNPGARGLVGVESWFWAQGYDGTPITRQVSAFGMVVDVEITAASVHWDFGDGTSTTGDLGLAYPQRSTVTHAYRTDSGGPGHDYTVSMTVDFAPRFRVDGGAWSPLPDINKSQSVAYHVIQAQAVVTGG